MKTKTPRPLWTPTHRTIARIIERADSGLPLDLDVLAQIERALIELDLQHQRDQRTLEVALREYEEVMLQNKAIQAELESRVEEKARRLIDSQVHSHAHRMASLGEMAGGIAHEIKNPLTVILGSISALRQQAKTGNAVSPAELEKNLDRMERVSIRINRIVDGLRLFSREGSGDPLTEVDLVAIIRDTLDLCMERFRFHGVAIDLLVPQENLIVVGRSAQLGQVVLNLLSNAFDAVSASEHKQVWLEVAAAESTVTLRVRDSGPGVPATVEAKLFQPFFTTKPVGKGTGLGLSISLGIAKECGGELVLNRQVSASCFELRLVRPPSATQVAA